MLKQYKIPFQCECYSYQLDCVVREKYGIHELRKTEVLDGLVVGVVHNTSWLSMHTDEPIDSRFEK